MEFRLKPKAQPQAGAHFLPFLETGKYIGAQNFKNMFQPHAYLQVILRFAGVQVIYVYHFLQFSFPDKR